MQTYFKLCYLNNEYNNNNNNNKKLKIEECE